MFLPLITIYLGIVIIFYLLFRQFRKSKLCWLKNEKCALITLLGRTIWGTMEKMIGQIKKQMDGIIIYLADQKLDLSSLRSCIPFGWFEVIPETFDHEMSFEIDRLVSNFCKVYINNWHEKILIENLHYKANFRQNLCKSLEKIINALYQFSLEQTRDPELFLKFGEHFEHCLRQHRDRDQECSPEITASHEERFFANLLDIVFEQVLPQELIDALLECKYEDEKEGEDEDEEKGKEEEEEDDDDDEEQIIDEPICLEESVNPFRLFVYNIIIYTFLIPTVNKISKPFYLLYLLLQLLTPLSKVSLFDLINEFDKTYFEIDDDYNCDGDASVLYDSSLYEAIEDSKNELLIFTNVRITSANVSCSVKDNKKKKSYIDYTIVYTVLEVEEQRTENDTAKHTFVQRTYHVNRRFREFILFQTKLEKNEKLKPFVINMPSRPSEIQFQHVPLMSYIKPSKINEDSRLVRFRRKFLQIFLKDITNIAQVNESKELAKFLGYTHRKVVKVRLILEQTANKSNLERLDKTGNSLVKLRQNLMKAFKFLLPEKAKYGQVSAEADDIVVTAQVTSRYSFKRYPIIVSREPMELQEELDDWFQANVLEKLNYNGFFQLEDNFYSKPLKIEQERICQKFVDIAWLLMFKNDDFLRDSLLKERFLAVVKMIFERLQLGKITLAGVVRHYYLGQVRKLANLLGSFDSEIDEEDNEESISFEEFHEFFKEKTWQEILERYCQLWERPTTIKVVDEKENKANLWRSHRQWLEQLLHRWLVRLFGPKILCPNVFVNFINQNDNKLLIYHLLNFINQNLATKTADEVVANESINNE